MTDPIAKLAQFLAGHVEWMRHRPEADEFLSAVDACARVVRGLARGPSEQRFLGPCGADIIPAMAEDGTFPLEAVGGICDGDVYAYRGAKHGTCRTCGAGVATGEREAWLDGEVRSRAFRASEIEDAYKVSANLIRQWATPDRGLIQVHGHDTQGRALYLLSQVLEVAAAQKAKQAEAQAKRARKAATRATDDLA